MQSATVPEVSHGTPVVVYACAVFRRDDENASSARYNILLQYNLYKIYTGVHSGGVIVVINAMRDLVRIRGPSSQLVVYDCA